MGGGGEWARAHGSNARPPIQYKWCNFILLFCMCFRYGLCLYRFSLFSMPLKFIFDRNIGVVWFSSKQLDVCTSPLICCIVDEHKQVPCCVGKMAKRKLKKKLYQKTAKNEISHTTEWNGNFHRFLCHINGSCVHTHTHQIPVPKDSNTKQIFILCF